MQAEALRAAAERHDPAHGAGFSRVSGRNGMERGLQFSDPYGEEGIMKKGTWIAVALLVIVLPACGGTGTDEGEDAGEDTGEHCDSIIAIDGPCMWWSYCVSDTEIVTCPNLSCEEVVGHSCCTGLQCAGSIGIGEECPTGQECFMHPGSRRASCRELDDPEIDTLGLGQYDTHPEDCNDVSWTPPEP
jgi:hypothetical protein